MPRPSSSPPPYSSPPEDQSELNEVQSILRIVMPVVTGGDSAARTTDEMRVTCADSLREPCDPELPIGLPPSFFVRDSQMRDALPSFEAYSSMMASRPSETSMVSCKSYPLQELPRAYVESRDISNIKAAWDPVLHEKTSRHLDLIEESVNGLSRTLSEIRGVITKFERDETAELIIQGFLDKFPGVRDVISQLDPPVSQNLGQPAPVVMACEEDDDLLYW